MGKMYSLYKLLLHTADFNFSSSAEISQLSVDNSISDDCSFSAHDWKFEP